VTCANHADQKIIGQDRDINKRAVRVMGRRRIERFPIHVMAVAIQKWVVPTPGKNSSHDLENFIAILSRPLLPEEPKHVICLATIDRA